MRLEEVRHVLVPITKISIPQMTAVALVGSGVALALGFGHVEALIIGLAVMYSSTAVVVGYDDVTRDSFPLWTR